MRKDPEDELYTPSNSSEIDNFVQRGLLLTLNRALQ